MKILGVSCGRPMGNCEILLKEALMAAETECGAEVEMIRLNDFEIRSCTGCHACHSRTPKHHGISDCIWDDDFPTFVEHYLKCDAIIVAAPIYIWAPSGNIRVLADRLGPTYDVAILRMHGADQPGSPYDQRIFKQRVGAFITAGGTTNPKYASMGMAPMRQFSHSLRTQIVDQMMCLDSTMPGQCLKHDDMIKKAHDMGIHVAQSCGVAEEQLQWYGDMGTCPVCHSNMMMIDNGAKKVKCPFCLVEGEVKVAADGKLSVDFSEADFAHARNTVAEMESHGREIGVQLADFENYKAEWLPQLAKYKTLDIPLIRPESAKWKVRKD